MPPDLFIAPSFILAQSWLAACGTVLVEDAVCQAEPPAHAKANGPGLGQPLWSPSTFLCQLQFQPHLGINTTSSTSPPGPSSALRAWPAFSLSFYPVALAGVCGLGWRIWLPDWAFSSVTHSHQHHSPPRAGLYDISLSHQPLRFLLLCSPAQTQPVHGTAESVIEVLAPVQDTDCTTGAILSTFMGYSIYF